MEKLRDMTEAEKRALRLFVLASGRTWKSKLRLFWMNPGVVTNEDERLLYCLRNTHGTGWLFKLRFP